MNKIKALRLAAVSAGLALAGSAAMAEPPAAVTSAINAMGTDGATIAGAVLVAIIAVLAIKFLRKAF